MSEARPWTEREALWLAYKQRFYWPGLTAHEAALIQQAWMAGWAAREAEAEATASD